MYIAILLPLQPPEKSWLQCQANGSVLKIFIMGMGTKRVLKRVSYSRCRPAMPCLCCFLSPKGLLGFSLCRELFLFVHRSPPVLSPPGRPPVHGCWGDIWHQWGVSEKNLVLATRPALGATTGSWRWKSERASCSHLLEIQPLCLHVANGDN